MIAQQYNLTLKQIDELPVSVYFEYFEASINIKNFERGEKLEMQTMNDKKKELLRDYEHFKSIGLID